MVQFFMPHSEVPIKIADKLAIKIIYDKK